jgi:hypothetical protein
VIIVRRRLWNVVADATRRSARASGRKAALRDTRHFIPEVGVTDSRV